MAIYARRLRRYAVTKSCKHYDLDEKSTSTMPGTATDITAARSVRLSRSCTLIMPLDWMVCHLPCP